MKAKIHDAVAASNNLEKSLISKLLEQGNENLLWEESDEFHKQLQESFAEADIEQVSENETVMDRLKRRAWRTE